MAFERSVTRDAAATDLKLVGSAAGAAWPMGSNAAWDRPTIRPCANKAFM
jgi:hypothetical protein